MDRLDVFVSLLFAIGSDYLNDDIVMELILDVGHVYVASYSRKKKTCGRPFSAVAAMPHVTVVIFRNSVETVCNLRLVKLNYSSVCYAAIEVTQER